MTTDTATRTRITLPKFTHDLTEYVEFTNEFSSEHLADEAFRCMDYEPALAAETIDWSPLDEFIEADDYDEVLAILSEGRSNTPLVTPMDVDDISDERKAELNAKYNLDELYQPFNDALSWAYERALSVSDDDIQRALEDSVEAMKGNEMYGVLTDVYWCGVYAAWPWGDVCTDEDAITTAVLDKAKVKGSKLTLTYAGTPYARGLIKLLRAEGEDDPGFGGNSEMELSTIARYVFDDAVKRLNTQRWDRIERGSVHVEQSDLRDLFKEFFRT